MNAKASRTEFRVREVDGTSLEGTLNALSEEGYQIHNIFQGNKSDNPGYVIVACRDVQQGAGIAFRRG